MAAADVGDAGAALQVLDDAVERGQPGRDEVRVVAGPEEPLAAVVDVVVVLVPADSGAAACGVGDPRRIEHRAERDLEEPGQVGRAVVVGQRDGLLGREAVAGFRWVVLHVAAGGLGVEPLAHVALVGAGARRELVGRERPGARERAVEAEPVADHDQCRVERGADLVDGAEDELLELAGVQRRPLMVVMGRPSVPAACISCNRDAEGCISRTDARRAPAAGASRGRARPAPSRPRRRR